jgi:hypothetical protein
MELWDNLLEKFRGPIEFQTQKRGEQIQAEIDYYNTPEGQRAAQIGGGIMLGMLPIPGSRFFGINRVTMPLINKTYGAVGKDMVGRAPLPVSKTPVQTARGPRGPINVDSSKQLPLPLKGGRNTGGLSETDKAMIDFIKPTVIGNKRFTGPAEHKHAIDQVADIGSGKYRVNKPLNKDRYPRKSDRILNRRPANAEEVGIIEDLTKKGFYDKSGSKGIMNTPSAKSHMEKIGAAKRTEQLANRRKFLEDALRLDQSRIKAGEAPSKDYSKLLEEYTRLIESLK